VSTLPAHLVATPVLELLGGERSGVVLGAGATAVWVDLDGFVVAVTTREVPLLPNAVALGGGSGTLAHPGVGPGAPARLSPGRVDLGTLRVTWDPAAPPAWDPTVPVPPDADRDAVARRGAALLGALGVGFDPAAPDPTTPHPPGPDPPVDSRAHAASRSATLPHRGIRQRRVGLPAAPGIRQPGAAWPAALVGELARIGLPTAVDPDGAAALRRLFRGVRERDPVSTAAGARALLGRGPGLTPEGDDLLAAVAGTLAILGPTTGLRGTDLAGLLTAIGGKGSRRAGPPTPAAGRTTALSETLLVLAAAGRLAEPAGRLLDLGPNGEAGWPAALARLERLGHGSGRAYAAGIAVATSLLATGTSAGRGAGWARPP
jgi:Protein of unknown function (DUF2877)